MFKYKNVSDQKQVIVGVGEAEPGETIESEQPIENPNFELVGKERLVGVASADRKDSRKI